MESVTLWQGAVYRHREPTLVGPLACPVCGTPPGAPRHMRTRTVEHPDADQTTYLVLRMGQYPCAQPACPQKYFTPPLVEAAPYAHTSRRLQQSATAVYRQGRAQSGVVLMRLAGLRPDRKAEIVASFIRARTAELERSFTVIAPSTARIRRPRR